MGEGGESGSQAIQKYRELGSSMPAQHRCVGDVTQGGKKRQEAARNCNTVHCQRPSRQEKVEDYGKRVG